MNKDSIKLDNNTYAVINENGNTRIVSTINSNDQKTMKRILLKENDIEELENKLKQYKKQLQSVKIDSILANTLEIFPLGIFILIIITCTPPTINEFIPLGITGILTLPAIKLFSIGMFKTRKKRKQLKQEAEYEIPNLEQIIENTKKELEKIKDEALFTELTNINDKTSNFNYVYTYDPNNTNIEELTEEEKNKEIHIMKLSKIKFK